MIQLKKMLYIIGTIFILSACGTNSSDELVADALYPHSAEVQDGDFIYTISTEQDVYEEFGDTAIFAELTYVGDEPSIDIYHATSPFHFPIEERTRGIEIDFAMNHPLIVSTLVKDQPLRERYHFAGGYSDTDDDDYVTFIKTIIDNGFPEGYYIMKGSAQFSTEDPSIATEEQKINLTTNIGFSVVKSVNK